MSPPTFDPTEYKEGIHQEWQQAWEEIETALQKYEGPQGFESPCELIVGVGRKAA